jgi:hypothetical protein
MKQLVTVAEIMIDLGGDAIIVDRRRGLTANRASGDDAAAHLNSIEPPISLVVRAVV